MTDDNEAGEGGEGVTLMRCNRCHRPMLGTTAYDGACACGGLIEAVPSSTNLAQENAA